MDADEESRNILNKDSKGGIAPMTICMYHCSHEPQESAAGFFGSSSTSNQIQATDQWRTSNIGNHQKFMHTYSNHYDKAKKAGKGWAFGKHQPLGSCMLSRSQPKKPSKKCRKETSNSDLQVFGYSGKFRVVKLSWKHWKPRTITTSAVEFEKQQGTWWYLHMKPKYFAIDASYSVTSNMSARSNLNSSDISVVLKCIIYIYINIYTHIIKAWKPSDVAPLTKQNKLTFATCIYQCCGGLPSGRQNPAIRLPPAVTHTKWQNGQS